MISRRILLLASAWTAAPSIAIGAGSPKWQSGSHYTELPSPTHVSRSEIEVIEFFWYGCTHCYTFEPHLVLWNGRLPNDVKLQRIPVAWRAERIPHARLYYTLRSLGRVEDLHEAVFDTIHRVRNKLETLEQQIEFARAHGIDGDDFSRAYNSQAVEADLRRSQDTVKKYQIIGVPSLAINGRYTTDVGRVDSERQLILLLNFLIERERALIKLSAAR